MDESPRQPRQPRQARHGHDASRRQGHLEAQIRRTIQTILSRGLNDPRIRGLVSVTEVNLAPDHSNIRVGISVLPGEFGPLTIAGLRHAAARIHGQIGKALPIRRVPRLDFHLDETLKKQAQLDALLTDPDFPDDADSPQPEETP